MRLAALFVVLALAPQDDLVKKVAPDAEKIKRSTRKIPPAGREKIEKALGAKLAEADLAPLLYECSATVPAITSSEKTPVRVVVLPGKGPQGPFRLAVSVAWLESTVHAVKLLENGDAKGLESPGFLGAFSGFEYSTALSSPPDVLAAALQKAKGADDASKELAALVRMSLLMRAMDAPYHRLLSDPKDPAADVAELARLNEESIALLPALKFLAPAQQQKFRDFAQGAKADLAEIRAAKREDVARRVGKLEADRCSRCHGAYKQRFRDARLERGAGNGWFSTKVDLPAPDPALVPAYDALGAAVRKAVLLASEAR
jgi:hypothetical protein